MCVVSAARASVLPRRRQRGAWGGRLCPACRGEMGGAFVGAVAAAAEAGPQPESDVLIRNRKRVRDDLAAMAERQRRARPRSLLRPLELEFMCGPTGSGKTKAAMRLYGPISPEPAFWWRPDGTTTWLPDYKGERVVVFDEFYNEEEEEARVNLTDIKALCNSAPCTFQTKGGHASMLAEKIVFTSCTAPERWYTDPKGEWARRIKAFGTKFRCVNPAVMPVGVRFGEAGWEESADEDE